MKILQIAWRNLWRNRKRTVITVAAVCLAVLLSTFMSSMQEGTYAKMIDNVVKYYSGYLQIHQPDYWKSKSINDLFEPNAKIVSAIESDKKIKIFVPRLESFTLISSGDNTKGCALIGIDPVKENEFTGLAKWVKSGKYLVPGDSGLLLAVNLAKNLNVGVGDTLVLLSQGYHGASASALMPIRGILKFPSPQLNNFGAYIDINSARQFFSTGNKVTSIAILLDNYHEVRQVKNDLQRKLGKSLNVMTWDEMQPDLLKMIDGDRAGGILMKGILYLLVGFGILGTIIMMMSERKKELGVMVAVGMQKRRLQLMLFYETILIGLLGVLVGFLLSIPIIATLVQHPIPIPGEMAKAYETFGIEPVMFFSMIPKVFVNQVITIFIITFFIALYPIITLIRMKTIRALRG